MCLCVFVCCTQAPMHVVFTTVAAAACASPYQGVGGVPAPKTKYWTLPTTPAAKVGARILPECRCVCVCVCAAIFVCTHLEWFEFADLQRGNNFFFCDFCSSHFCRLPERPFSGFGPKSGVWILLCLLRIRLWCSGGVMVVCGTEESIFSLNDLAKNLLCKYVGVCVCERVIYVRIFVWFFYVNQRNFKGTSYFCSFIIKSLKRIFVVIFFLLFGGPNFSSERRSFLQHHALTKLFVVSSSRPEPHCTKLGLCDPRSVTKPRSTNSQHVSGCTKTHPGWKQMDSSSQVKPGSNVHRLYLYIATLNTLK